MPKLLEKDKLVKTLYANNETDAENFISRCYE